MERIFYIALLFQQDAHKKIPTAIPKPTEGSNAPPVQRALFLLHVDRTLQTYSYECKNTKPKAKMKTTLPKPRKYREILMGHLGTPRQQQDLDVLLKIQKIVKNDGKISPVRPFVRTPTCLGKEARPEALWANFGEFYQIPKGMSTFEQLECEYADQKMTLGDKETNNC